MDQFKEFTYSVSGKGGTPVEQASAWLAEQGGTIEVVDQSQSSGPDGAVTSFTVRYRPRPTPRLAHFNRSPDNPHLNAADQAAIWLAREGRGVTVIGISHSDHTGGTPLNVLIVYTENG